MERSVLARHRKRRLADATQHASTRSELESVFALAAATTAACAVMHTSLADAANDAIHALRNAKNSVYHRALAARALGLLVVHDPNLSSRLRMESEDLVDALLQIVTFCRYSRIQNADTRRIHVNCCLVISLVMQAPGKHLQLLVSLDSALLVMRERPSECDSNSLFLTVAGRPESSSSNDARSTTALSQALGSNSAQVASGHATTTTAAAIASLPLGAIRSSKRIKLPPPRRDRPASQQQQQQQSNQEAAASHFEYGSASHALSPPPVDRSATPALAAALAAHALPTTTSSNSSSTSHAPPSRVFKMDRFRVVTPAFVQQTSTPSSFLPVIQPSRELLQHSDAIDDARDDDDDATSCVAAAADVVVVPPPPLASATLLHPTHMLEVFRTKQMPLASPAFFSRPLMDRSRSRNSKSPTRLHVIEWSEWQQRGWTEETATAAAADVQRPSSPAPPFIATTLDATRTTQLPATTTTSAAASVKPARRALVAPSTTSNNNNKDPRAVVDDIDTPASKQQRLRAILHAPIEPIAANAAHFQSLATRVNTSILQSLNAETNALKRDAQQSRDAMHALIQAERDQLPLKFLFQLPGGAAYCRDRMRRALALWIAVFEFNQQRLALLQWKAFVDYGRFAERGRAYQRLAAMQRLRVAIEFVLRGFQAQAFATWRDVTQVLIWRDRDCAARRIQTHVRRSAGTRRLLALHDAAPVGSRVLRDVYLAPCRDVAFHLPKRLRLERRALWRAATHIQHAFHYRRFRRFLQRYRNAATTIQAQQRMRVVRNDYMRLRKRIVAFQSFVRMWRQRRVFLAVRTAAVCVQTSYRSMRTRRVRRLVLCAQRQQHERVLSRTLLLQRVVRGFLGRCNARQLERDRDEAFHAALVVQRCWYRRNNEWSTFLLLGCLREQERFENAFNARVCVYTRQLMANRIRRTWLAWRTRKRAHAALALQCLWRRVTATRSVQHRRDGLMAHRRIKWFLRTHHAERMRVATQLQFAWLRAVPGRLTRHLQQLRLAQAQRDARTLYMRHAHAATQLQALARGHNDRVVARRERSARTLQHAIRTFLQRRRVQHERRRLQRVMAERVGAASVTAACTRVLERRMRVLHAAATQLQRCYRGAFARSRAIQQIVAAALRVRMALAIQRTWRRNAHRRIARKLLTAQQRRLANPFAGLATMRAVLHATIAQSSLLWDPRDALSGMALATWLRRLGLDGAYLPRFQRSRLLLGDGDPSSSSSSSDSSIRAINADALRRLRSGDSDASRALLDAIGIDDDDDVERMLTSLFAQTTIDAAAQQRRRVAAACDQQAIRQRQNDAASLQLHKRTAQLRDAEEALNAVLDDMRDFRNPPSALKRQHAACTAALADALAARAHAQQHCDAATAALATATRVLEHAQQQLRDNVAPHEVSALYSAQCLALITDSNRVRELFLIHFPGLEARALAFATTLTDVDVTTWQLEQFFATNTSVSAVKTAMKQLTYFVAETDVKALDSVRYTDCSDVLQFGVERLCDLLQLPLAVVALDRRFADRDGEETNRVCDLLLDTIDAAQRTSRAVERVQQWRAGVDALCALDAMALRVQCLFRRRAATKVLAAVRDNRQRNRLLAAYVADAHADRVTPVWAAERKREQDELDAWLAQQARAHRLACLAAIPRFPYTDAVYDDASQSYWLYYDVGGTRQFAPRDDASGRYSIEDDDAAATIGRAVRGYVARLAWIANERLERRAERRAALESAWHQLARERVQTVTLHVRVRSIANRALAAWLAKRRSAAQHRTRAAAMDNLSSSSSSATQQQPKHKPTKTRKGSRKPQQQPRQRRQSDAIGNINVQAPTLSPTAASADAVDSAWSKRIDALVDGPLATAYNHSVRAAHRKDATFPVASRPLHVHGQAIVGLLHQVVAFSAATAATPVSDALLHYTKGALRFGWTHVRPRSVDQQSYYYNNTSHATTWTRPTYAFEHEMAALTIQSIARIVVARNVVAQMLTRVSLVDVVEAAVQAAATLGWIGFGVEGLTTTAFVHRLGFTKYATALATASIDDVLALSVARIKQIGLSKDDVAVLRVVATVLRPQQPQRRALYRCSTAAAINASLRVVLATTKQHPFAFVRSERVVQQLVAQSLPNQQGRVRALVDAVRTSTTPISYRQLDGHLRRFAGRPDDALRCIDEIASLECVTRAPQERAICTRLLRATERCVVLAANLQLASLQRHLSAMLVAAMQLLRSGEDDAVEADAFAFALAPTTPLSLDVLACATMTTTHELPQQEDGDNIVAQYVDRALARYPDRLVRGLWEADPTSHTPPQLSPAQAALYVREEALECVLRYVRSALRCQATFRMHVVRTWYHATRAFRARNATLLQCAWRQRVARDERALLVAQQQSDYEQCVDARGEFSFVYVPTHETLLDAPRDETGAAIAFRPMVQDRVTHRWVRAWPQFDKHTTRPRPATDDDRMTVAVSARVSCSVCRVERAARRCNECYAPTGDYVDYCLACFFDQHAPENAATSWHTYTALRTASSTATTTTHLHCVECRRFATQRCVQCDEHYCARCFQRVHTKGATRSTHQCELFAAMARVCVECDVRVALAQCLVCLDALCEDCLARTHSRGARVQHATKLLQQPLEAGQVYCVQCHARCGDMRCEYCASALCCVCATDRHALVCPETELKLKRDALLGDSVCVECSKPADRACATCGDRYCSVRWMGNPGCFERFHAKGKRADHVAVAYEPPAMSPELRELEARVKQKRKQDAADAEMEANALAAAMLAAASAPASASDRPSYQQARSTSSSRKKSVHATSSLSAHRTDNRGGGSKRRLVDAALRGGKRRCAVDSCKALALGDAIAFCTKHFTLQHALDTTHGDPLEAAKLLAQIESDGDLGEQRAKNGFFFGNNASLFGSLLQRTDKPAALEDTNARRKRKKRMKAAVTASETVGNTS